MTDERLADLPPEIARALDDFIESAREAFGSDLEAVILFGSAAEGALRATSDVNVILVLATFQPAHAAAFRRGLRTAHAAANLSAMFLLSSEVSAAAEAFAQKFADIARRHRVLYGTDPFEALDVPRSALLTRLNQVLLNLTLRLRAAYVERGLREEQLAHVIADAAGPLRTCAANLIALATGEAPPPKEALERLTASYAEADWKAVLTTITQARTGSELPAGVAEDTLARLIDLANRMRQRAAELARRP